ncbi:unnamed protein product, partial [Brassica oleracea]
VGLCYCLYTTDSNDIISSQLKMGEDEHGELKPAFIAESGN